MRKIVLKFGTTLALAAMFGSVSAQTKVNAQPPIIGVSQLSTLSASNATNSNSGYISWKDSITGNPSQCKGGGFWNQTYGNNGGFRIGNFKLTHNSGFNIYSYWGGFTTGANGDNLCYTSNCTQSLAPCAASGSGGWIYNQWGCMAGGGISSISSGTAVVQKGLPYLIAYWDYFSDGINPNSKSLQINLADSSLFSPQEIWICNHPWSYYGNIYGDGFARKLNQVGDYFRLYIHAIHNDNSHDSIAVNLAYYDDDLEELVQSSIWRQVSLTGLGSNVKMLYFTMKSTDELIIGSTNYGPNTAVYFCMDKLKITQSGVLSSKEVVQQVQRSQSETPPAVEVVNYFPVASVSGGKVVVYDTNNKEVLNITVEAGEKINLSMLPAGEYRLQHGNRVIPITKKGGEK